MIVPSQWRSAAVTINHNGFPLVIRPATLNDVDSFLEVQSAAFADKFAAAFGKHASSRGVAAFRRIHQLQGANSLQGLYLAMLEERVVGTITLRTSDMRYDDGGVLDQVFLRELGTWGTIRATHVLSQLDHRIARDEGFITDVAVVPDLRRNGIAKLMMRHVIAIAREERKRFLSLYVSASNQKALDLYTGLGFKQEKIRHAWGNIVFWGQWRWVYMTYLV